MTLSLADVLNPQSLRRMAGAKSFSRGEEYFDEDRVSNLSEDGEALKAKVRGNHLYLVKLWVDGRDIG